MLTETLRKHYLDAMGIQAWYDPQLVVSEQPVAESPVTDSPAVASSAVEQVAEMPVADPAITPVASAQTSDTDSSALNLPESSTETPLAEPVQVISGDIRQAILNCNACELHASRAHALPGEGDMNARLLLIVHAPVNEAGQDVLLAAAEIEMLEAMLKAIGESLCSVFITSLVKCRPPEDRAPHTSELICCDDHLTAQIKQIQPTAIMLLGEQASQQLLVSQKSLMDLRLRHHQHMGVPVFASYHPHELINSADNKRKVWQDLLQIKKQLVKSD